MQQTELLISRWLPFHLALAFIILPAKVLIAIILSVVIHELGHFIAIKWCSLPVYCIKLNLNGAKIITVPMSSQQELICAAAGPLSNFLLILFARHFPLLAVCSMFHGIFNLLPIGKMDGRRILIAMYQLLKQKAA